MIFVPTWIAIFPDFLLICSNPLGPENCAWRTKGLFLQLSPGTPVCLDDRAREVVFAEEISSSHDLIKLF